MLCNDALGLKLYTMLNCVVVLHVQKVLHCGVLCCGLFRVAFRCVALRCAVLLCVAL